MSLQNLSLTVTGLKENIETEKARLSCLMNSNNPNLSEFHTKFAIFLNRYSRFASEYKHDLDSFHKLLINKIDLEQMKEDNRIEQLIQERLETLSNKSSNLEIAENVEETGYSSANPVSYDGVKHEESESEQNVSIHNLPTPKPMKAKKSIPVSLPTKSAPVKSTKVVKPATKAPKSKKTKTSKPQRKTAKPAKKSSPAPVVIEQQNVQNIDNNNNEMKMDKVYEYNANTVAWQYNGSVRSSTIIYIGNIANNISMGNLEHFVKKEAKVNMSQIEETKLRQGGRSQYALVRFRSDVKMTTIRSFMNKINTENAQIAEEKKKRSMGGMKIQKKTDKKKKVNGDNKQKKEDKQKVLKTSWKTRVYIRFNANFRYYETEQEMYNDPMATPTLFIRNFNIVDKECHSELSKVLLGFGELGMDISIDVDRWNDPFCIATFKHIEDAIYCRNSEIYFKNRMLEINYYNR